MEYTAPGDGFLSLALCNERGQLVRSLLYAQPVKPGKGSVTWDGTSDLGVPLPAGRYTTKAIFFREAPRAEYVMTVGKSGNPPYRTPDGRGDWGGNLGGPAAICSNSNSVMMVWSCVEDPQITGIQQMDNDGKILARYYSFYPWDGRLAGAMDDRNFYLGILNTGKKQVEIAAYELGKPRGKILTELPTQPHESQEETRWRGRFTASLDGLALTDDTLYATIADDNALFVIDRATGRIRKQVTVDSPRDVKIASGGKGLILQTGSKIVLCTLDGTPEHTLVPEGVLHDPRALAVDPKGGFYSSGVNGQIGYFSAEGKLVARIGQEGGAARTGRFNSQAIGRVYSMCLGPAGDTLWVQDTATGFPRTSRWSRDGKLEREWFTPKLDLFAPTINPAHPNELIATYSALADEPGIRAYEVDWAARSWRPGWFYDNTWAETYSCTDVYAGFEHSGNPLAKPRGDSTVPIFHYDGRKFVTHGGRNYFINSSGNGDGAVFEYSPDHQPRPVALVGYHHTILRADGKYAAIYDQGPNQWFTWADRNGDGRMSANEITHVKDVPALQGLTRVSTGELDADLNVHLKIGSSGDDFILPPKEILPNGTPVYDWAMVQRRAVRMPSFAGGDGTKEVRYVSMHVPVEGESARFTLCQPEPTQRLRLPGVDGLGWWGSRNWRSKLVKIDDRTGDWLWAVGRRAPGVASPGQMYHPMNVAGKSGDAIFVPDTLGPLWVWHTDGLYLGHLFKDQQAGEKGLTPDQEMYGEIQSTFLFTHPQTGKLYHIGSGTETRIHEITVPAVERLAVTRVDLKPGDASRARPWDPDGVTPTEKPHFVALHTPVNVPGTYRVKVDGDIDGREGWNGVDGLRHPPMLVMLDGQNLAEVRVMYDEENLYLAYKVSHPNGPANSGSELPYAPFVSGAYVDFCVGPDWTQPQRNEVREGDVRVVAARVRNGAGASDETNFHQAFWPRKKGGANPQTIASPAATIRFDDIATIPGFQMACKAGPRDERSGNINYVVEIAVPLASLGLHDVAGKTVGFDASVGVANAAGDQRDRAAHWAGLSEGRVVDRPGSAQLLPHTWGTLTFAPPAVTGAR